ncbi:MAG: hypothetical protein Q9222_000672 [Ikaeria aurantiellina]
MWVVEQYKIQSMGVKYDERREELKETQDVWNAAWETEGKEKRRLVMVVIATCRIAPPADDSEDEDLLVVDASMFHELYGTLEPLLRLVRLDVNTADEKTLHGRIDNHSTVSKILALRGSGFKGRKDFQQRLAEANESLGDWAEEIDEWAF